MKHVGGVAAVADGGREVDQRRNTFDAIRLFAAFAVVIQHTTAHVDVTLLWVEPYSPWWFYDGVPLFFIISGLFVYRSGEKLHAKGVDWRSFYRNRFLRVAPAIWVYLAVTTVTLLAIGVVAVEELASVPGLAWLVSTLALAPAYSPGFLDDFGVGHINGSLWTIPVEVSFYVVLPLLVLAAGWFGGRRLVVALLGGGLALGLVPVFASGLWVELYRFTFLPYLWYFGIGIAWHYLSRRGVSPTRVWAVLGAAAYVAGKTIGYQVGGETQKVLTLLAALPLSLAVIYVGRNGPAFLESFTRRVGDLSFGVYVWHMPIVNTLLWLGAGGSIAAGYGAVALTFVMAWLSWHVVEKRALARKRATSRAVAAAPLPADRVPAVGDRLTTSG